ncbi:MAG: hypothetical protein IKC26_09045 [Clostridia bacterium]|nr:hypothetical protein [Clostridia bacterium]
MFIPLIIFVLMKLKADRESRMKEMEDEVKESLAQSIRPRVNLPQNRTEYDSLERSLYELRLRFEGRGMMHSVRRDARRQSAAAMSTRAMAPGAYAEYGVRVTVSDRFRTGEYNGERYMTSADFVRYYAEHRSKMRPDADLRYMAVTRDEGRNVPKPKQKKPLLAPAGEENRRFVSKVVSKLPTSVREKHPALQERAAEVHKWMKSETIREMPTSEKRKLPISVASAILVLLISLSLVVGGTVMHSTANSDYRDAVNELEAIEAEELALEHQLAARMSLTEIESYARDTLGMVDKAYAEGVYLDGTREEVVEVYEEEKPTFGLSTLLSALGIGS